MYEVSGKLLLIIGLLVVVIFCIVGYFNVFNFTATNEYNISDSTFKIPDMWKLRSSTNDSMTFDYYNVVANDFHPTVSIGMTLILKQYTNNSTFESQYQYSKNSSGNYIVVNAENKTIAGIQVRSINNTKTDTETFLDYYFQKNGKYYSLTIEKKKDALNNNQYNPVIKTTVEIIISTIS